VTWQWEFALLKQFVGTKTHRLILLANLKMISSRPLDGDSDDHGMHAIVVTVATTVTVTTVAAGDSGDSGDRGDRGEFLYRGVGILLNVGMMACWCHVGSVCGALMT
jgi:hypothetical protein